ncbi:hypothetical protein D3C76_1806660 [compost metagenome]
MAVALRDERSNALATLTLTAINFRFTRERIAELYTLLSTEARKLDALLACGGRSQGRR